VISLKCEIHSFVPSLARGFLYLLGGDYPYTHFTFHTERRPTEPYYTVGLIPVQADSPATFSVCRESRAVAQSSGYKLWRFENAYGRSKEIMWNPKIDTILLHTQVFFDKSVLDVFVAQFLLQLKEVRRLAVWSNLWLRDDEFPLRRLSHLTLFDSLKEFIVVVDEEWERKISTEIGVHRVPFQQQQSTPWIIPQVVNEALNEAKKRAAWSFPNSKTPGKNWNVPVVRVVRDEGGILTGENKEMALRCFPCYALNLGDAQMPLHYDWA